MKRRKLVAGNWKMNLGLADAIKLAEALGSSASTFKCDVMVFPSYAFISDVKRNIGDIVKVGAQDCSHKDNGAFTGEVSAQMLASLGLEYVILGHSERRDHFSEGNEVLRTKLQLSLKYGLKPLFCCGEPLDIRNQNDQEDYVRMQLEETLLGFSPDEIKDVVIAYEPVWAIGTGLNATPMQAQQMHNFIRRQLAKRYNDDFASQTRILYGGSCKPDNAKELFLCPDVDGGLIGGASLNAKDFITIIRSV